MLVFDYRFHGILLQVSDCFFFSESLPLQHLPPKPGFVPVFIRYGDEPLESINPALAVAFHEGGFEGRNIKEDDSEGQMLADDPSPTVPITAPKTEDSPTSDVKETNDKQIVEKPKIAEVIVPQTATPELTPSPDSAASDSNESGPAEEPKALPVQNEKTTVNDKVVEEKVI